MEVGDWEQSSLSFFQPPLGVGAVALGTTAVLAGVVAIVDVAALLVALLQMPPHLLGAAGGYGKQRPLVAIGHSVAKRLQILWAMFSDNFRQLDHGWSPAIMPFKLTWSRVVILSVTWV